MPRPECAAVEIDWQLLMSCYIVSIITSIINSIYLSIPELCVFHPVYDTVQAGIKVSRHGTVKMAWAMVYNITSICNLQKVNDEDEEVEILHGSYIENIFSRNFSIRFWRQLSVIIRLSIAAIVYPYC